jgi:tRNA dimethylallyltransferase
MQVYKGMGIITSRPSRKLLNKVPHHLLGTVDLRKDYNVSQYRKDALRRLRAILKKKKIPVFSGGTGLYMSILLDGIFNSGQVNTALRKRLLAQAEKSGSPALYKQLEKVDPQAARKIHPHDAKRIIRAIEVFETTGKPISELQKQRQGLWDEFNVRIFCLNMQREKLYARINERVEKMFERGMVDEARQILKKKLSRSASFAIGLREIKGYLDAEYSLDQAKELIKKNTRNYAKRQLTWFRKDKRIEWVKIGPKDKPEKIAAKLWKKLS